MTEQGPELKTLEAKTDAELLAESISTIIELGKKAIDRGYDIRLSLELRTIADDLGHARSEARGAVERTGRNVFAEHIQASNTSSGN